MSLHLHNTLSAKLEPFAPAANNEVRMYACGPTVYDYVHIGNLRTIVAVDILHRFLLQSGHKVRHVMNITDVDDKIIRNAARENLSVHEYTTKYEKAFLEDAANLNIKEPILVRATDHIQKMAEFIAALVKKDFAYRAEDGSYYFRIAKFPEYGKLSKKDFTALEDGSRVDLDEYDKDSARDFALWKAPKPGEASWDTVIGPGRPGWHIECSVMAMEALGNTLDIHCGGEDLIFPHHENEIAQSESYSGKIFSRFWFHSRFLLFNNEKMAKSQGNFFTLRDLVLKGFKPSSIRFMLASVPYHTQLNFTVEGLQQAAASVERLRNFNQRLTTTEFPAGSSDAMQQLARVTEENLRLGMDDDLNTAQAQGAIFEMVRATNAAIDAGTLRKDDAPVLLAALQKFDDIFSVLKDEDAPRVKAIVEWAQSAGREKDVSKEAIDIANSAQLSDEAVNQKLAEIETARRSRDFKTSDALRAELAAAGILVENTKAGVRWRRK